MKRGVVAAIVILLVVVLAAATYLWYFYYPVCQEKECFSEKLVACSRASFIADNPETVFEYKIIGKTKEDSIEKCKTNVRLIQLKQGSQELAILEGKEMYCLTDLGTLIAPEENLKNCHGLLKEELQELTIQKLHSQIVSNLGELNE
jgi:hypothetical protein